MTIGTKLLVLALGCLLVALVLQFVPMARAVRARNAMLLQRSRPQDFSWVPPAFPAGFKVETLPPRREFRDVVELVRKGLAGGDLSLALALAGHLTERAQDKGPVQMDPLSTYRRIREGYGYCADFVKVFLVLAHTAGIGARRWAFSFDGFGGHGHTVVEIFDRESNRWVMLDVYNNFHVIDANTKEPLGALEFRDALAGKRGAFVMRRNGPGRLGFVHEDKALAYYRNGIDQWYLLWGTAVASIYAHPAVRLMGRLSPIAQQAAATLFGLQPRIHVYETTENVDDVRKLFRLRRALRAIIWSIVVLVVILGAQLAWPAFDVRARTESVTRDKPIPTALRGPGGGDVAGLPRAIGGVALADSPGRQRRGEGV